MTIENSKIIEELNRDFLHAYLNLASKRTPVTLHDGEGIPVRIEHTTIHKFGPGYSEILKNEKRVRKFYAMRGCVTRADQAQFIQVLQGVLE